MSTVSDVFLDFLKLILGILMYLGAIIIPFFLIFLPTLLNFAVTALCVLQLKKLHKNIFALITFSIALSFLFAMNVRVIDVISDLTTKHSYHPDANKKITLAHGSTITLVNNTESLSYKKWPLVNPFPRSVSGKCMCILYNYPNVITENIKKTVSDHGLAINNDKKNTIELNISVHSDDFIAMLEILLRQDGNTIAKKKVRIRQKYYGDLDLSSFERLENGNPIPYLSRSTFWNLILRFTGLIPDQQPEIANFIDQHIIINTPKMQPK